MKKRIKVAVGIMMLFVLTACSGEETQPNLNLEHDGVITQQAATDNTFPNIQEKVTILNAERAIPHL